MSALESMQLGKACYTISRLGMGCWAIGGHGWGKVSDEDSINAVRCALDNGVNFFDTADVYGFGKSETLLASALDSFRNKVVIASKGGVRWNEAGKVWTDISPAYLRLAVEGSLKRLKLDCIPLYYIHKPDNITPIQESIAALERMREEGMIGAIGVANFSVDQLLQALQVAKVTAVQVRQNIFERNTSKTLLSICKKYGVTIVAWGALADGLLTGKFTSKSRFESDDHRCRTAFFQGPAFLRNLKCLDEIRKVALIRGVVLSQLSLRYLLDSIDCACVLFGAKTETQVRENIGANNWSLTPEEHATINSIVKQFNISY
jgi:myo-inositol catabolism protein IolS